jgi:peptidoglycan LD-endopeptidase LytH
MRNLLRRRIVRYLLLLLVVLVVAFAGLYYLWVRGRIGYSPTKDQLANFFSDPDHRAALITDLQAPCPGAPFRLPAKGFVGLLYADPTAPYFPFNPHPGIDIFGDGEPGTVPVYAAYDGYLTRLPDWKSSVIIRIPHDPLDPSRQIWTYYAHMASKSGDESYISADFPAGTSEKFVTQGTLLGYEGLFNGAALLPIKMHLHFSIVSSDADGSFRNETRFGNTIDPSPYFGLTLNATNNPTIPVKCNP